MKKRMVALCMFLLVFLTSCTNGQRISLREIAKEWVAPTEIGEKYKEESGEYRIKIQYPYTGSEKIDSYIEESIVGMEQDFRNIAKEIQYESDQPPGEYDLFAEYKKYAYSEDIISFKYEIVRDFGGKNDERLILCKTYIFSQNRELGLVDILKGDYLKTIVPIARQKLLDSGKLGETPDTDMQNQGTAAVPENYRNFVLTDESIIFFFEQYQVAHRNYGEQQVEIRFDEIAEIMY